MKKLLAVILCLLLSGVAVAAEPDEVAVECKKRLLYETTGFLEDLGLLDMKKDAGRLKVEQLEKHKLAVVDHKGEEIAKMFPNGIEIYYQNIYRVTAPNIRGERVEMMVFAEGSNIDCPGFLQMVLLTSPVVIQLNFMHKDSPHSSRESYIERWKKYKKEIDSWATTRIN